MVPMLRCGLLRSNFCLAMSSPSLLFGGLPLALRELLCDGMRNFCVMQELHRISGATLAHGAHIRCVTEHLGERHPGPDDLRVAARLHALDLPPAGIDVSDDVTHVLLRRHDLDSHDGL